MIGIVEIVDRVMLRSGQAGRIRTEANRLVGDFGLDAYFEAGQGSATRTIWRRRGCGAVRSQ